MPKITCQLQPCLPPRCPRTPRNLNIYLGPLEVLLSHELPQALPLGVGEGAVPALAPSVTPVCCTQPDPRHHRNEYGDLQAVSILDTTQCPQECLWLLSGTEGTGLRVSNTLTTGTAASPHDRDKRDKKE